MCIKKEKKQNMVRVGEKKNIHQYKRNISTMYVKTVTRPQYTRYDVSEIERKEKIHQVLTTSLNVHTPPNKNLLC